MIRILATYFIIFLASAQLFAQEWNWKLFDKMPMPVAGAELVTWNNKIYILGGYKEADGEPIATIQMYDPAACLQQRWTTVGEMHIPRANFIAKLYENETESCIYIAGGATDIKQENVPTMEKWDLRTNTGTILDADPMLNRIGATGEIWQDYLIILGGYNNAFQNTRLGFIAIYDILKGRSYFPKVPISNVEQYNHASITTGDSIYIFGGVRGGISNRIYNLNLGGSFDVWPPNNLGSIIPRVHPDLGFPRSSLAAVEMIDRSIWLIGGHSEDSTALRTTTKFVIKRSGQNRGYEHENAMPLLQARREHVAAVIDSVVYVFGGLDEHGKIINTVEAFIDTFIVEQCEDTTVISVKTNESPSFLLRQNYPNPFNHSTTIEFELAGGEHVCLDIYNANGQMIASLLDDKLVSGVHRVVWDGRTFTGDLVPSGVYLYKISTETETQTRKMLMVK